jgi:hypothetical protein
VGRPVSRGFARRVIIGQGFVYPFVHGGFSNDLHALVDGVVGEVAVEYIKVIVGSGRSADSGAVLTVHHIPARPIGQDIVTLTELFDGIGVGYLESNVITTRVDTNESASWKAGAMPDAEE